MLGHMNRTYQRARLNAQYAFPTGRHFAALALTTAPSRQTPFLVSGQNNQHIQQLATCDVAVLIANLGEKARGEEFTVHELFLAGAEPTTIPYAPCGTCFEFLSMNQFLPDCIVYYLTCDEKTNGLVIKTIRLNEWLPLTKRTDDLIFTLENPDDFNDMVPMISESASAVMGPDYPLGRLQNLMLETITAYHYEIPKGAMVKAPPLVSGVLLTPSAQATEDTQKKLAQLLSYVKRAFHFSRRDNNPPDKFSTDFLFEEATKLDIPENELTVSAITYYGEKINGMLPSLSTLGSITRHRGSDDTLISVIENGQWFIRTVSDYTPEVYKGSRGDIRNGLYYEA